MSKGPRAKKPPPSIAKLFVQGAWIVVKTPYESDFIQDLKDEIPYTHRKWDKAEKVWKVDVDEMDAIEQLCRKYFKEVRFIEVDQPKLEDFSGSPYHDMLVDVPNDALKRVYRLIAASIHPDQGGSEAGMSKVNDAWHLIKKERKM